MLPTPSQSSSFSSSSSPPSPICAYLRLSAVKKQKTERTFIRSVDTKISLFYRRLEKMILLPSGAHIMPRLITPVICFSSSTGALGTSADMV